MGIFRRLSNWLEWQREQRDKPSEPSKKALEWAACHFSDNLGTAAVVGDILSEQLGIPLSEIYPHSRFCEDLDATDLEPVEIVMALEEEFRIEITDEDAERLPTVQRLVDFLNERLSQFPD